MMTNKEIRVMIEGMGENELEALKEELEAHQPCSVHSGQIHGGEAQELRKGIETILKELRGGDGDETVQEMLQNLLDQVDARDSLAHMEYVDKVKEEVATEYIMPAQIRHDVLKAMGVEANMAWTWITGELTERRQWMLEARTRLREKGLGAGAIAPDPLLVKTDEMPTLIPGVAEVMPPRPSSATAVDMTRRRLLKAGFTEKLKIGDWVTIADDGLRYAPAVVVEITGEYYTLMLSARPSDKEMLKEARWEGWNAALDAIAEDHNCEEVSVNHVTVATAALKGVMAMVEGYRHLILMKKQFKDMLVDTESGDDQG